MYDFSREKHLISYIAHRTSDIKQANGNRV